MSAVEQLSTPTLRAIRDLCPSKPGEKVTLSSRGVSVTLTHESRQKAERELKRRQSATEAAK